MGWHCEIDPAHEGYPVALVAEDPEGRGYVRFVELGYYGDPRPVDLARVHVFQVACECGWRSRRFYAPLTASYSPHSLDLGDEKAEDEARAIWLRHVKDAAFHDAERVLKVSHLFPYKWGA